MIPGWSVSSELPGLDLFWAGSGIALLLIRFALVGSETRYHMIFF